MIFRIIHASVIVAMVAAATYVYDIKFQSTMQAERLAKIRSEIRRERDAIAALRAEWAKLDSPDRIEGLAKRHSPLKPTDARQFDQFANLPERPKPPLFADQPDPIGMLLSIEQEKDIPTGSTGGRSGR